MNPRFHQGGWSRPIRQTRPESRWMHDLFGAIMFWICLITACLVVTGAYEFLRVAIYTLTHFFPGS